jgi:streptogramin lyase
MRVSAAIVALVALFVAITSVSQSAVAEGIEGTVMIGGQPLGGATVTLWRTTGKEAPKSLAEVSTDASGGFKIREDSAHAEGDIFYLTTKGGSSAAVALMSVLGTKPPEKVVVNELTTVASVFTSARFIDGTALSGNKLGLRIAAGNAPNLVDPETGSWGDILLDPINSTENTTLAKVNTLGSLIVAFATVADDDWRTSFFKAATPTSGATPKTTLEAVAGIAQTPWAAPKELFALFDKAYPQPKDGSPRSAPFVPYLGYVPDDFALLLKFAGGGVYAAGRLMFDSEGNLWSGQNWMPGSQSGVVNGIGGGVAKIAPDGTPLSPPISGFTGMGLDGVGWGTAVTHDKVWATSFNGKILVLDFDGNPIGTEKDFPFTEELTGLMGVGAAANGDVWIAEGSGNRLLHFPGGRVKDGKLVSVDGLKSPFDIVIDSQNRVWVSNSQSDTLLRFPADAPSKVESFRAGISVRALALDSKGNVWVTSMQSLDFPPAKIPDGVSIMKQFQLAGEHLFKVLESGEFKSTGVINMFRPDGSQPDAKGYSGDGINVPWGINVDGNDDIWVGSFYGRGAVLMAGDDTEGHAAGTKTGDVIHVFESGSIQMVTDVAIDPAGNVWVANNWNNPEAALASDPARPISTFGGGDGIVVIYGVAGPVLPPRMGRVQKP